MLYNGVEVQTIKLVLSGTESTGISSKQVLLNCIVYLTEKYRESREFSYLEKLFGICMHIWNWDFPMQTEKKFFKQFLIFYV